MPAKKTNSTASSTVVRRSAKKAPSARKTASKKSVNVPVVDEKFLEAVRFEAYLLSERRGFIPGYEEQDWLEAERIVLERQGA